ncbi:hypothetical protein, partial [Mycobacterium avium]|uniref:hypothetical protein n=1 Tax=Mycobacterium avium TaxID=1764 RepID=UPI0012DAC7BE
MSKVTLTTELPIPVETASALARKPEMMRHVLSPVLRIYRLDVPERIEVGTQGSARFWLFGVIPAWTRLVPRNLYVPAHVDYRRASHRATISSVARGCSAVGSASPCQG